MQHKSEDELVDDDNRPRIARSESVAHRKYVRCLGELGCGIDPYDAIAAGRHIKGTSQWGVFCLILVGLLSGNLAYAFINYQKVVDAKAFPVGVSGWAEIDTFPTFNVLVCLIPGPGVSTLKITRANSVYHCDASKSAPAPDGASARRRLADTPPDPPACKAFEEKVALADIDYTRVEAAPQPGQKPQRRSQADTYKCKVWDSAEFSELFALDSAVSAEAQLFLGNTTSRQDPGSEAGGSLLYVIPFLRATEQLDEPADANFANGAFVAYPSATILEATATSYSAFKDGENTPAKIDVQLAVSHTDHVGYNGVTQTSGARLQFFKTVRAFSSSVHTVVEEPAYSVSEFLSAIMAAVGLSASIFAWFFPTTDSSPMHFRWSKETQLAIQRAKLQEVLGENGVSVGSDGGLVLGGQAKHSRQEVVNSMGDGSVHGVATRRSNV